MSIIEWFQTAKGELLAAGLAGSSVAAVMEWEGILPAIRRLAVGVTTSFYLGPVGIPLFSWVFGKASIPIEQSTTVSGFIIGVGGVVIIEIILKAFRFRRDNINETEK